MERYETALPPAYFRSAKVVLFVYCIDSIDSITNIRGWTETVSPQRREYLGHSGKLIEVLVGNKVDMDASGKREVDKSQNEITADDFNMSLFHEISALDGTEFDELFEDIVREIRKDSTAGKEKEVVTLSPPNVGGNEAGVNEVGESGEGGSKCSC